MGFLSAKFEWRYWYQAVPIIRVSRVTKRSKAGLRPAIAGAKAIAVLEELPAAEQDLEV